VQEGDGHRVHAGLRQLARQAFHEPHVQLAGDAAVGQRALGHVEAEIPGHQRLGQLELDVVKLEARLLADLDGVAKAGRRQQGGAGALALDDGVGDQRGAVDHLRRLRGGDAGAAERVGEGGLHRARGILGRGQGLGDRELAARLVDQDQVGEGAADVDADAVHRYRAGRLGYLESGKMSTCGERCCASRPPSATSMVPLT